MKPHQIMLIICWIVPFQFFGQATIDGKVFDEKTNQPVPFASVYIDGSTNGCLTDSVGKFHLGKIRFPCTLIVSHLTYVTHSTLLKDRGALPLRIVLSAKDIKLKEVDVKDKNLRARNLYNFKTQFLGEDVWAVNATIENEQAIHFSKDYKTEQAKIYNKIVPNFISLRANNIEWSEDSTLVTYQIDKNLKATSSEPLIINLPLLGYQCSYDMLEFVWQYQQGQNLDYCFNLGYSFFKQLPYQSKRDSIRIQNNRLKNYYNSAQHFRKSLYEKRLAQNGYKVFGTIKNELTGKEEMIEVDLESCLQMKDNCAQVIGLQGVKLKILYYATIKGTPVDLTQRRGMIPIDSEMILISDTCTIWDNGSVSENSIVFGPAIGAKKFGSLLPEDYFPTE